MFYSPLPIFQAIFVIVLKILVHNCYKSYFKIKLVVLYASINTTSGIVDVYLDYNNVNSKKIHVWPILLC